jgi:hypothetical protein
MINFHAIETEAEFRRQEWLRDAKTDRLAAQALITSPRLRWPHWPQVSLARLRSLAAPRLPFAASLTPRREPAGAAHLVDC